VVATHRPRGTFHAAEVAHCYDIYLLVQALEGLLPPKKTDVEPKPAIVDDARYEECNMAEVRARSFPAGSDFFDQGFASQFGEGADDDAWEDDEDEGADPECRTQ